MKMFFKFFVQIVVVLLWVRYKKASLLCPPLNSEKANYHEQNVKPQGITSEDFVKKKKTVASFLFILHNCFVFANLTRKLIQNSDLMILKAP